MSDRDNQIQKYFDIDKNGRLTPEHFAPSENADDDGIGADFSEFSLTAFLSVLFLFLFVAMFAVIALLGGG